MPYPTQITKEAVVEKARELIEAEGIDQLSLARLASALNVKAPSLYRYFDGKNGLLRAVNEATSEALLKHLIGAVNDTPEQDCQRIIVMTHAYRAFAHQFPVTYTLLFANTSPELRPNADVTAQAVLPLQSVMASLSGEADSLAALRGVMALVHGYVILEMNAQFQRGGDLDATFTRIVEAFIDGWRSSNN